MVRAGRSTAADLGCVSRLPVHRLRVEQKDSVVGGRAARLNLLADASATSICLLLLLLHVPNVRHVATSILLLLLCGRPLRQQAL